MGFRKWEGMSDDEKAVLVLETVVQVGQTISDNVFLWEQYLEDEKAYYAAAQLEEENMRNAHKDDNRRAQQDPNQEHQEAAALNDETESLNSRSPDKMQTRVGKFNRTANWVRGLVMMVTAALVITMAVALFNHLGDMDTANKFSAITQFALQTLTLITSAVEFAAEAAYSLEYITQAAFTTAMNVTIFAGAALVLLGITAMIAVSI